MQAITLFSPSNFTQNIKLFNHYLKLMAIQRLKKTNHADKHRFD